MSGLCEICERRVSREIGGCERETIPSSASDDAETLGIRLDCYINGFHRLEVEVETLRARCESIQARNAALEADNEQLRIDLCAHEQHAQCKAGYCPICNRRWNATPGTGYCTSQHGVCGVCGEPRLICVCQTTGFAGADLKDGGGK